MAYDPNGDDDVPPMPWWFPVIFLLLVLNLLAYLTFR